MSIKNALNKDMKKTASPAQLLLKQGKFFIILSAVLFLALAVLSYKYLALRGSWHKYGVQSLQSNDKQRDMDSTEDAQLIATTIGQFPEGAPLLQQSSQLTKYVAAVTKQTGRDIVVVDKKGMILADAIPANVGKKYSEDKSGEVLKTITDGQPRTFIEESTDYPRGIHQAVVPLKNAAGATVGAVILSGSNIFK
jgi:sensor histidine kinase regulating citrate/malate metabolism